MTGSSTPPDAHSTKRPSSRLAGPYGHPFHPIVATVPVGAFVSSLVFDILTLTRTHGLPYLVDGAYWLIGVGLVSALLAAAFGLMDLRTIPRGTRAFRTAMRHLVLNALVAGLFLAGYLWRAGDHVELEKTRAGQVALSSLAVALLVASVWFGGTLAYRFGVRVADEQTQADGYRS